MTSHLIAFLGIAAVLTITPGADMALVTRTALGSGRRSAMLTSFGVITGLLAWATASGVGLAALLTASATAFMLLKLLGAAYLLVLGVTTLWRAGPRVVHPGQEGGTVVERHRLTAGAAYRQGVLSNLLNPKVGVFYTTFLPQFIAPGDSVFRMSLLLGGLHCLMGLTWLLAYGYIVTRAGDLLRRPAIRRGLERLTAFVLIGFGVRLATETR